MIDDRTPNLDLPLPNVANNPRNEDVGRLREALTTIDAEVSGRLVRVDTREALAELHPSAASAYLKENGRAGQFAFVSGDLSALVTSDPLHGIYIAPDSDPSGASGAWVRQRDGLSVNPMWFGANMDDEADDFAATQAAIDMIPDLDGYGFIIPNGVLRTSQKLVWDKKRATFNCLGRISPHGEHDDFLIEFRFDNGPVINNNVGFRPNIERLELDCEWQSRGVKIFNPYLCLFPEIYVARSYGTALEIDGGFECSFLSTILTLGQNRNEAWFEAGGFGSWTAGQAYSVGDRVRVGYSDWSAGTTYASGDCVSYGGKPYRSIIDANTGNDPTDMANAGKWVRGNYEYYQCLVNNTDKNPHAGFTVNNETPGNRYWRMIPWHDPLLKIDNSTPTTLVDNMYFFGLMIRDSDNKTFIWADSNANEKITINLKFIGCQIHGMTTGMQAEIAGQNGGTPILLDDMEDSTVCYFGRVARSYFTDTHLRAVINDKGTVLQLGAKDPNKICFAIGAKDLELSGEGARQVGINVMPSVFADEFYLGSIINYMAGTGALLAADPGQRLNGRMPFRQRFADGSSVRPGLAFSSDPSMGFTYVAPGVAEFYAQGVKVARFGVSGGEAYVELPAKVKLGPLPSAGNDVDAGSAGVEVGYLYRNSSALLQRQT